MIHGHQRLNRYRAATVLLASTLLSGSLHSQIEKPTTIWSEQARTWGQWELIESNQTSASFRPQGRSGEAHVVVNYDAVPLDLSDYVYAAVDARNETNGKLDISISALSNPAQPWSNEVAGRFILDADQSDTLDVFMLRKAMGEQTPWVQQLGNLYAFPNGYQRHWRFLETDAIKRVNIKVSWKGLSGNDNKIHLGKPKGDQVLDTSLAQLKELPVPLTDTMGQLREASWDGRIDDPQVLPQDGLSDQAKYDGATYLNSDAYSSYGGYLQDFQLEATGRFRTHKQDGKWWLVDPEGHIFWSLGVTEAGIGALTRFQKREHLFPQLAERSDKDVWVMERGKTLSYNFYNSNLKKKYGDNWRELHYRVTEGRMRTWGLNSIGAWSMEPGTVFASKRPTVPYTVIVHTDLWGGLGNLHEMVDPFSKQFDESLSHNLEQSARLYNGDPNNIGIFVNNELHWLGGIDLPLEILRLGNHIPAKQMLLAGLKKKYRSIDALNKAWQSEFDGFAKIKSNKELKENHAFIEDMKAYYKCFAETFFAKCKAAINRHFPGHLYLGCRFNVFNPIVTSAASDYCDVISFNLYQNSVADFKVKTTTDRPYLISEFHFGSGSHGVWGRGLTPCADPENQVDLYRAYVEEALKHPNFVGAHWFTWADQPVTGRYDGENFRVGLVSIVDRPYTSLIKSISDTAKTMYHIRLEK